MISNLINILRHFINFLNKINTDNRSKDLRKIQYLEEKLHQKKNEIKNLKSNHARIILSMMHHYNK
ncbi:hypothetical protein [Flavobacterium hydatis]|jgi:hypothetical protein|uniref:hypothetical protein n=1 Tax=Flavobacterium hydatis TaxID=991 RepID=UPI00103D587C|nr:hypothetical protein [Flavobacterium hydatis]